MLPVLFVIMALAGAWWCLEGVLLLLFGAGCLLARRPAVPPDLAMPPGDRR